MLFQLLFSIFCNFYAWFFLINPIKEVQVLKETIEQKQEKRFLSSFDNETINWNENIDLLFYNRIGINDEIEKKWKSRQLLVSSSRGTIIMYYNVFYQGFSYYSDSSSIPYNILNAVAMKYTLIYRCRDFFIDENILPETKLSPFIGFIIEDLRLENKKKKKALCDETIYDKNSPFVKFKTRLPPSLEKNIKSNNLIQNRFLNLGKFYNCEILQKNKTITVSMKRLKKDTTYKSYKEIYL
jgi:hypothetical protein